MEHPRERRRRLRSARRNHRFRFRRRAMKIYPTWPEAWKAGDHLKTCSCWMCGNPRRHAKGKERLRVQERRLEMPPEP